MTNRQLPLDRRTVLRTTGAALAGTGLLSGTATAQTSGGDEIWSFQIAGVPLSSPTVVDDTVFIGSHDDGAEPFEGAMYALDAGDGTEQWRFDVDGEVVTSPNVVDDTVFFGTYPPDSSVYALDANDGSVQWRFETELNVVVNSLIVADGTVFVGTGGFDGYMYALDASDGTEQWRIGNGTVPYIVDAVVDGTVFVSSGESLSGLRAFDASDGTEQWRRNHRGGRRGGGLTVADGTVFVASHYADPAGAPSQLYAMDAMTGDDQWMVEFDGQTTIPTVADGTVYLMGMHGYAYALNTDDGTEQWRFETTEGLQLSPTVADGTVITGSAGGVYALDAVDGSQQWQFIDPSNLSFSASPTVVEGVVFVGGLPEGWVYALNAGVEGSSDGSRVNLATLGHHHVWADQQSSDNASPTAEAGDDQTVEEDAMVALDGSGSSDPDGDSLTYSWAQTSGPDVSLTDADTATPEFTAPEVDSETDFTFELTVDDGEASDTDTTVVTVTDSDAGEDGPPPIVGDTPPQDLDGDGLFEDLDGDGDFGISDVQVFFQHRNSDIVQDNAGFFNFSGTDPDEVTIADVQALFQSFQDRN